MSGRHNTGSGLPLKFTIAVIVLYAVESGLMHLLALLNLENSPIAPVLDGLAITSLMAPMIYLLFMKPMKRDLEEKKALITSKDKLGRTLLTVSNCNQALIRAKDKQQLMDDICRILTETGGYRMAWVGLAGHDAEKTVRLAAYSGHNEGYVETLDITWADTERGQSPIGSSIRAGKPVVVRKIASNAHFLSGGGYREAMKRGYAAMAALPLTDGETAIGSLNIYSDRPDEFDVDEMRLLTELANDLSFGIRHHRIMEEWERARFELDLRYRISQIFLNVPDDGMYADVLDVILDAMKSKYGSFGYINGTGDLICPSMTRDVYEKCNVPEKSIVFPRATWGGLWGRSLIEKRTLYQNSPYRVPGGHIPITRSVSTPIIYQDKLVGHLHMGNKESDYDETDVLLLENLAGTIAPVLAARLEKQAQDAARQKMRGELEASEGKYRGLVENALVGIARSTLDGEITYANNALLKMFEFGSLDEFISGGALNRWKNPEDRKAMVEELKNHGSAIIGAEMLTMTGKTITISFSASLSDDGISATIIDVTERKKGEEALRRAYEDLETTLKSLEKATSVLVAQEKLASIGTLSAGVAHEILNPLNIIGTIVQVMQMDEWPTAVKENLAEIMTQVRRATKITDNLRRFAHQRKPERVPLDIHALFDKTAMLLEHDLLLDNIQIERDFPRDIPVIYADEDQMAQIFLNLLNNARDAMRGRRNGTITVKTRVVSLGVEVRFSDNGPGIPKENINRIFDPFFTTKDPGKGTGLGLSILHTIIQEHKGSITVESETGKGATFIILLPIRKEAR